MRRPVSLKKENKISIELYRNRREELAEIPVKYVTNISYSLTEISTMTIEIPNKIYTRGETHDFLLYEQIKGKMFVIVNLNGVLSRLIIDEDITVTEEKGIKKKQLKAYSYEKTISTILNRPLEDEEIDNEDKTKASFLALDMFEGKNENGECIPIYQRDSFFDAIPVSGDTNADGKLFAKDFITPHKNPFKDPEPICFMKIRSNVKFRFYFSLHDGDKDKDRVNVSKEEKLMLIKYLLYKNGLGAKTNVGYGQFKFSEDEMLRITQQKE